MFVGLWALMESINLQVIPGVLGATDWTVCLAHLAAGAIHIVLASVCVVLGCKWAVELGDDLMDDEEGDDMLDAEEGNGPTHPNPK